MKELEAATLFIAAGGLILGILNTWQSWPRERVWLRVRFLNRRTVQSGKPTGFTIEVTNLGIPVTVKEVGLSLSPPWKRAFERLLMMPNETTHTDLLPFRLESRRQANFSFDALPVAERPTRTWFVYAKTECGVYAKGSRTPAFQKLRKRLMKGGG